MKSCNYIHLNWFKKIFGCIAASIIILLVQMTTFVNVCLHM